MAVSQKGKIMTWYPVFPTLVDKWRNESLPLIFKTKCAITTKFDLNHQNVRVGNSDATTKSFNEEGDIGWWHHEVPK